MLGSSTARVGNVMTIRLYADPQHRREHIEWRARFERILTRANRVTEPELGVGFEIKDARLWERSEPIAEGLDAALVELEALDAAEDTDLVVAFVSSLTVFTPDIHEVGMARAFGRHIVMRGVNDPRELDQLLAYKDDDAEQVYQERIAHREVTLFLHELGHTLGAMHIRGEDLFMSPYWTKDVVRYDPQNLEMMSTVLRHRLRARGESKLSPEALAEIRALLQEPIWAAHQSSAVEQAKLLVALGQPTVRQRSAYEAALRELSEERFDQAWDRVRVLQQQTPEDGAIAQLVCQVGQRAQRPYAEVKAACAKATQLLPESTGALIELARVVVLGKEFAEAEPILSNIRARCSQGQCLTGDRVRAAEVHADARLLTFAGQLAATATASSGGVTDWLKTAKDYYRPPTTIAPEQEGTYARALDAIETKLQEKDAKSALTLIAKAEKQRLSSGRIDLAACRAHLNQAALSKAQKSCTAALKKDDQDPLIHFYVAVLAKAAGNSSKAKTHAKKALELDPKLEAAKSLLTK